MYKKLPLAFIHPGALALYYLNTDNRALKEDELLAALVMSQFCEDQVGHPCRIGYEVKDAYWKELADIDEFSSPDLDQFFRKYARQDTKTDFAITFDGKAICFQLKRCGFGRKSVDAFAFAEFLNKQRESYGSTGDDKAVLLVWLEGTREMDIQEILGKLEVGTDYPFARIMYSYRTAPDDNIYIGELWPDLGHSVYRIDQQGKLTNLLGVEVEEPRPGS